MQDEIFLGVILAAIGGVYWALFRLHGCVEALKKDVKHSGDFEYIKEEITDIKDSVRQLNG